MTLKETIKLSIEENIKGVKNNLPEGVTLIAVSKTKPISLIKEAYDFGIRDFGENKVQELVNKYDKLPDDIRWHMIGHLQRNKVKYIVGKVYLIHSLDSVRLLDEIEKQYKNGGKVCNALIQINIGKEESKTGIYLENLEELIKKCEQCTNVNIKGLMAVIPKGDERTCRMYFNQMKNIFDNLKRRKFKNIEMDILSMGMTHDYRYAVEEGSNMVRVGEGVFGKRDYNNK